MRKNDVFVSETCMVVKFGACDMCRVIKRVAVCELPHRGCVYICADCAKGIAESVRRIEDTDTRMA